MEGTFLVLPGMHLMFLVLGNATVDEAMAVETWPTPGQTIVVGAPRRDLGGKGANQAIVLRRAGAPVRFVAAVGRDAEGDWVAAALAEAGLPEVDLLRVAAPTDRSLIFVHRDGENAICSTVGAALAIGPAEAERALAGLGIGDGLLLQGNLSLDTTRAAIAAARRRGVTTMLNPSPVDAGFAQLIGLIDLLIVNEGEAAAFGIEPSEAGLRRARAAGTREVVLTLGPRGALGIDADGRTTHVPALPVPAIDTVGAGDTFTGVLIAARHQFGLGLGAAVAAARSAAAITVQRPGTVSAFPDAAEIRALVRA